MNEITTNPTTENIVPGFSSAAAIHQLQIITEVFNKSTLVPDCYRGEANKGNCAIVLALASRMNADPLMMLQNVYVVHGSPALSSKMMIALFNTSGKYTSIRYEETGTKGTESQGVRAYTTEISTGERITGPEVTLGIAKKEGWSTKNGSKWLTMPDQMLRYRAATWLIRTTAPELSMGLYTKDEMDDIQANKEKEKQDKMRNVTPPPQAAPVMLEDAVQAKAKERPAEKQPAPQPEPQMAMATKHKKAAAPAPKRSAYDYNEEELPPLAPPPEEPNF